MDQKYELSVRAKKRVMWRRIGLGVVAGAVTVRLGIALFGASQVGGGFNGLDVLLLSVVASAGLVAVGLPLVLHRHRRQLHAVRAVFPDKLVRQVNVLPTTLDRFLDAAPAPKLKVNVAAAGVFDVSELSLWRGTRNRRRVAHIVSEVPITYRAGTLEHYGRHFEAILATVRVGGTTQTIPFAVLSAHTRGFKMAVGTELEDIVAGLENRRQAVHSILGPQST